MNEKQQVKLEVVQQNKMKNGQKSLITAPHTPKYPKNSARFQLFSVVSFSLTGSLNPNTVGRQANKRLVSCLQALNGSYGTKCKSLTE